MVYFGAYSLSATLHLPLQLVYSVVKASEILDSTSY